MKNYKIAVIAGDGIGPEVIAEGVRVLEHVAKLDGGFQFEFTHFPWGCEYYLKNGKMMPDDALLARSTCYEDSRIVVMCKRTSP